MRATRAHRDNRRSHHALDATRITTDAKTGSVHQRHRADLVTGMYRGKKVITIKSANVETDSK
jgi:ribosomal protein L32